LSNRVGLLIAAKLFKLKHLMKCGMERVGPAT